MRMLITAYLTGVSALCFSMHAEDKAVSNGLLPFLGRVPGNFFKTREEDAWDAVVGPPPQDRRRLLPALRTLT